MNFEGLPPLPAPIFFTGANQPLPHRRPIFGRPEEINPEVFPGEIKEKEIRKLKAKTRGRPRDDARTRQRSLK